MPVRVETVRHGPGGTVAVRVRSAVGAAEVLWRGAPTDVGREHHVEWTVDEDLARGASVRPAALSSPPVHGAPCQVVLRGRLSLTGGGGAVLEVAGAHILFDLADPPPPAAAEGTWAEVRVDRSRVSLWPCLL